MSWDHPTRGRLRRASAMAALAALVLASCSTTTGTETSAKTVSVIVREVPGYAAVPERTVERLGGRVGQHLGLIDGFVAEVPESVLPILESLDGVHSVTADGPVHPLQEVPEPEAPVMQFPPEDQSAGSSVGSTAEVPEVDAPVLEEPLQAPLVQSTVRGRGHDDDEEESYEESDEEFDPSSDPGSMYTVARRVTRAADFWAEGFTGQGVDVAMIDTGVVPVNGLKFAGKVINGADLSFESQAPNFRYMDTYGHGTHMAGIIAGRDNGVSSPLKAEEDDFLGMAPGARVLSVKVADANGATDVSQVIAAIDWVVQHRHDHGMNIRVLNLSFGTDGVQNYILDPLAYAAEMAWRKGIVVVVAAGNEGYGSEKLNNPAYDPYVIAVGAADGKGTYRHGDDEVSDFSSCGSGYRHPDLVAPGKSIVSLRNPRSNIDLTYPGGRVNERFFRGSGTSQAAAVVSGAAALLIDQRPSITPDQVKALLTSTAAHLGDEDDDCQGAGMLDLAAARGAPTPRTVQTWPPATGLGSLEKARGSVHLVHNGVELRGERDIFGNRWRPRRWALDCLLERSWVGGEWNGHPWTGDAWSGLSWSGMSWGGLSWSGLSWSGLSWSGMSWSGMSWSGLSWSGMSWSGMSWSGDEWAVDAWSTRTWE